MTDWQKLKSVSWFLVKMTFFQLLAYVMYITPNPIYHKITMWMINEAEKSIETLEKLNND